MIASQVRQTNTSRLKTTVHDQHLTIYEGYLIVL